MLKSILAGLVLVFGVAVTSVTVQTTKAEAGINIYIPTPGIHIGSRGRCYNHRHRGYRRHRHCGRHVHRSKRYRRHCHKRWRNGRSYRRCHRHRYRH